MLTNIETSRLTLRRWQEEDLGSFIRINADPEVMRYFPAAYGEERSKYFYELILKEFSAYGYGPYAAEEKSSGKFMGFIGFHGANLATDFCPCIEIAWRLDKDFWNRGYATEGAKACLEHGFKHLGFDKVYSFTAIENQASQRVMQKIGMRFERYFDHPEIAENHFLKPHVLYTLP